MLYRRLIEVDNTQLHFLNSRASSACWRTSPSNEHFKKTSEEQLDDLLKPQLSRSRFTTTCAWGRFRFRTSSYSIAAAA